MSIICRRKRRRDSTKSMETTELAFTDSQESSKEFNPIYSMKEHGGLSALALLYSQDYHSKRESLIEVSAYEFT